MVYFIALGTRVYALLTPIGAQLVAFGMILVGIAALRARVWGGWRMLAPFVVGLYPLLDPVCRPHPHGHGHGHGQTALHLRWVVGRDSDIARLHRLFKHQ